MIRTVTVNGITYTFTEWEEIDEVYIHIFTDKGIICVPKELVDLSIV